jgi:hypothetical protein
MNLFSRVITVSLLGSLALLGVSCSAPQTESPNEQPSGNNRPLTLYGSEEKDGYIENVEIKIADLKLHIGKLKEKRAEIDPSRQTAFDASLAELDNRMAEFLVTFESFRASPLESFLPERAKVNEKLVLVEDLYFEIITEYDLVL